MDERKVDLDALAAEAMAKTKNPEAARRLMVSRAQNNPAVAAAMIWLAAGDLVSRFHTIGRRRALSIARNPDRAMSDGSLASVGSIVLHGLLAWALPGLQKPLGEATREEVAESLRYCKTMGDSYYVSYRFLGNVHRLATDEKQPIRKQLSAAQVKSCHERAEKAS